MGLYEFFKFRSRTTVGQGASGLRIGFENLFVGTKNLCSLAHEVNAAKHNDAGVVQFRGDACQRQRVADVIGNILN